jgi:hypothetical protein
MPLRSTQALAIGHWPRALCSGTFVSDEWVLTAKHCGVRSGDRFCVGDVPGNPDRCTEVSTVVDHPTMDLTLARARSRASSLAPGIEPIPVMTERLDARWIERLAEAAGYGMQEHHTTATYVPERRFVALPIVALEASRAVVDGRGERGVCGGDSGGPLLVLADDGTVRVAGALQGGDSSCVGRDFYTRTDTTLEWIERSIGRVVAPGASCEGIPAEGLCVGNSTARCVDGRVAVERCSDRCGWSVASSGYRCLTQPDPCGGLDYRGSCDGDVARWCDRGVLRERDCAACGDALRCDVVPELGGAYCTPASVVRPDPGPGSEPAPPPAPPPTDPCDAFGQDDARAQAIRLEGPMNGEICAGDDDWYFVPSGGELTLRFSHSRGDLDLEAFDASGSRLGSSETSTDQERYVHRAPFYVRVYGYRGASGTYQIAVR